MKKSILMLMASLALILAACGGGSSNPEAVAESYMKAAFKFDYGAMKKLSAEKNKASLDKQEAEMKSNKQAEEKKKLWAGMSVKGSETTKTSEDGNSVTVKVLTQDKDKKESSFKVNLIKEGNAWKVDSTSK